VRTIAAQAISTGRLDLLPLLVGHADEMATVLSDPALHTFTGGTPDTPQALRCRDQRGVAQPASSVARYPAIVVSQSSTIRGRRPP
jgi:hypothetical protein